MSGTVADFSSAFHDIEESPFGQGPGMAAGEAEKEEEAQTTAGEREEPADDASRENNAAALSLRESRPRRRL